MASSYIFFCEECGAANSNDAAICFVCHEPLVHPDEQQEQPAQQVTSSNGQAYQVQLVSAALPVLAGPLLTGSLLKERYRVISEIGQGGYGVVYKARDTKRRNKVVAIKQINLSALTTRQAIEVTDSFNREVQILSKLRHKNLPRIYEHFTDPQHWYVVMDYIEGQTLEDYLTHTKHGHLSARETARIGRQLARVLGYLHWQHPPIIFRDVKPANIMRTPRGRLYLIDFGIARLFNPQKTRDTGPLGSPGFAAPEQYGRAQSTIQTDIYGLGATLQALLPGSDTAEQAANEPVSERTDSLHSATKMAEARAVPRSMQKLLDQMLEPDAARRPKNMQEVKRRLELLPINIPTLLLNIFRRSFWGLVIGSFPYSFLLLSLLLSQIPVIGQILGWPVLLPTLISFSLWQAVLGSQLIAAIALLFSKNHRYMGLGILVMLAALALAAVPGWLPWPWHIMNQFFSFHFRFT